MKIGIHAQALMTPYPNGIGLYVRHLVRELLRLDRENEYLLLAKPGFAFSYRGFARAFREGSCDVALIPKEVVPPFLKKPVVVVAHDLYCYDKPRYFGYWMHTQLAVRAHFRRADHIIAVSEDTKKEVVRLAGVAPEKITVVPLAYDRDVFKLYSEADIKEIKQKYQLHSYFINISSVFWERKNLIRLLEAFKDIREQQIVFVGKKGPSFPKMQEIIARHRIKALILEDVPAKELALLLGGAEALVFPSVHEGFGLPVLEAMACGCPVITSDRSALPEVAGGGALLVNPFDIEEIRAAMKGIKREALVAKGLERAKQFSWEKTARQTLDILCRMQ